MSSTREKIAAVAIPLVGLGSCIAATVGQKILEGGVSGSIINQDSLVYGSVGVIGGVAVNLLSNTAQTLFGKLSDSLVTKHPNQLNHDIQKALVKASDHALNNLLILYKEEKPSKADLKKAKDFISSVRNEVNKFFSSTSALTGYDIHVEQFIHAPVEDAKAQIEQSLHTALKNADMPPSFIRLFQETFVDQLKLCFTQQLKANSNAWVAFQKTMLEGLKGDLTNLLEGQARIEDQLKELSKKSSPQKIPRLSARQTTAAERLLKEINQPARIQVALEKALEDYFSEIIQRLTNIDKRLIGIDEKVSSLREEVKAERVHWWSRKMVVAYITAGALAVSSIIIYRYYAGKPFTLTVKVRDPEDAGNIVLKSVGKISITYGNKTEQQNIDQNGQAYFFQIPGKYRNDSTTIIISDLGGEPYRQVDPGQKYRLTPESVAEVSVQTYGLNKISGMVYNENSLPVAGATVKMNGLEMNTNDNGEFLFEIPRDKQRRFQNITVVKKGYKPSGIDSISPHTQTNRLEIVLYR